MLLGATVMLITFCLRLLTKVPPFNISRSSAVRLSRRDLSRALISRRALHNLMRVGITLKDQWEVFTIFKINYFYNFLLKNLYFSKQPYVNCHLPYIPAVVIVSHKGPGTPGCMFTEWQLTLLKHLILNQRVPVFILFSFAQL